MTKKILIVGQIPPPFLGQAIMTKHFIDSLEKDFKVYFINSSISSKSSDIGKISFSKIFLILKVILKIFCYRFLYNVNVLYYNPSGHRKIAILRDIIILFSTRFMFKHTVFHFHAYGLNIAKQKLNYFQKILFNISFNKPKLFIKLTQDINIDENLIKPKKISILPNGIPDYFKKYNFQLKKNKSTFNLIYVGAIYKERGILDIVNLFHHLKEKRNSNFKITFVGDFIDSSYEFDLKKIISDKKIDSFFEFKGEKLGKEKFEIINNADVLIFPSIVPSETFGLVIVEAMQFYKPSIVTNINGPRYVTKDQYDGFHYKPGDIEDLYNKVLKLKTDKGLYKIMSENARKTYETKYTIENFKKNASAVMNEIYE